MGLKKILKKVGKGAKKVAPLIMAGLAAKALMGRKRGSVANTANMENIISRPHRVDDYNYPARVSDHPSNIQSIEGGGSAPMNWRRRTNKWLGTNFKKGGRTGAKKGGRIRKQFGGALPVGGTARRDMRSGYYPSDMGMRGGPMYKKGGRVTGIAKRGFGRALMKGKK